MASVKPPSGQDFFLQETKTGLQAVPLKWYHRIAKLLPPWSGIYGSGKVHLLVQNELVRIQGLGSSQLRLQALSNLKSHIEQVKDSAQYSGSNKANKVAQQQFESAIEKVENSSKMELDSLKLSFECLIANVKAGDENSKKTLETLIDNDSLGSRKLLDSDPNLLQDLVVAFKEYGIKKNINDLKDLPAYQELNKDHKSFGNYETEIPIWKQFISNENIPVSLRKVFRDQFISKAEAFLEDKTQTLETRKAFLGKLVKMFQDCEVMRITKPGSSLAERFAKLHNLSEELGKETRSKGLKASLPQLSSLRESSISGVDQTYLISKEFIKSLTTDEDKKLARIANKWIAKLPDYEKTLGNFGRARVGRFTFNGEPLKSRLPATTVFGTDTGNDSQKVNVGMIAEQLYEKIQSSGGVDPERAEQMVINILTFGAVEYTEVYNNFLSHEVFARDAGAKLYQEIGKAGDLKYAFTWDANASTCTYQRVGMHWLIQSGPGGIDAKVVGYGDLDYSVTVSRDPNQPVAIQLKMNEDPETIFAELANLDKATAQQLLSNPEKSQYRKFYLEAKLEQFNLLEKILGQKPTKAARSPDQDVNKKFFNNLELDMVAWEAILKDTQFPTGKLSDLFIEKAEEFLKDTSKPLQERLDFLLKASPVMAALRPEKKDTARLLKLSKSTYEEMLKNPLHYSINMRLVQESVTPIDLETKIDKAHSEKQSSGDVILSGITRRWSSKIPGFQKAVNVLGRQEIGKISLNDLSLVNMVPEGSKFTGNDLAQVQTATIAEQLYEKLLKEGIDSAQAEQIVIKLLHGLPPDSNQAAEHSDGPQMFSMALGDDSFFRLADPDPDSISWKFIFSKEQNVYSCMRTQNNALQHKVIKTGAYSNDIQSTCTTTVSGEPSADIAITFDLKKVSPST